MQQIETKSLLFERLLAGDVAALAYAISELENNTPIGRDIFRLVRNRQKSAPVIGFTGPPGVGKSTLINAYIHLLRKQGIRVAVVAIDPSSPVSGGAILGDRFRMMSHAGDSGVFIRSVSSRGHLGGLCASVFGIICLVAAAGWDYILVETVGAGQADTDLTDIADIRVVVQASGLGDDLQAIKAGILEIADVLVVNKADMPLADITVQHLEAMVELRSGPKTIVPVVKTIATQARGMNRLHDVIESLWAGWKSLQPAARYQKRMHRFLAREMGQMVQQTVAAMPPAKLALAYEQHLCGKNDLRKTAETIVQQMLSQFSQEEEKS